MTVSDRELVSNCLAGDSGSLRAFVHRYQGLVFSISYRMLGHRQDAEDVTQDVFVRALRSLHHWDSTRPLRPWLSTIAVNRCRTFLKSRGKRPALTEFTAEFSFTDSSQQSIDLAEELQLALEKIRENYRVCFILYYQQELSCSEIGEVLQCPSGTVKTWLFRARRELAEHLQRRGIVPSAHYELH